MNTQEILKKVRQIEIKSNGLSRQLFSGAYHSVFKGRGMSFSEVREYVSGDDVRHIDWNVSARNNQLFVKVFEEERELTLMLMVDVSASSQFGSNEQSKIHWMTEIAAVLAFSATKNQDKVGLILFSDKVHLFIPPKKGKQHILRIIRELLVEHTDNFNSNLDIPLKYLNQVISKRSICFILSDFRFEIPEATLKIVSKKHEIIGLEILDPLEFSLASVGLIQIKDLESRKECLLDTSDKNWLKEVSEKQTNISVQVKQKFSKANAAYLKINTNESYIKPLLNFFKSRKLK